MSFHSYRGQPGTKRQQQSGTWSQASTRHPGSSFDQHGRKLSWPADNRSGMPTGPIGFDFSAPWYPDQQYIKINPDDTTQAYIDYPEMFRDRKAALRTWHKDAVRWATRKEMPAPKFGQYSDAIIEALGDPPRALEMIAAAYQEHPWVLGQSETPDPRLVPFLEGTSADADVELEEMDFSIDSYNEAIAGAPKRPAKHQTREEPQGFFPKEDKRRAQEAELERELQEANAAGMDVIDGDEEEDLVIDDTAPVEAAADDDEDVEAEDELVDLDEEHDPEARGGRRMNPRTADRDAKKDARRPTQTAVKRKHGDRRSRGEAAAPADAKKSQGGGKPWNAAAHAGKSMADGAKPFVRQDRPAAAKKKVR